METQTASWETWCAEFEHGLRLAGVRILERLPTDGGGVSYRLQGFGRQLGFGTHPEYSVLPYSAAQDVIEDLQGGKTIQMHIFGVDAGPAR